MIHEIATDQMTSSSATNSYIWGLDLALSLQSSGGVGGLLATVASNEMYYPTTDANGNIVQYTDTSGGYVARYDYDAFGQVILRSGILANTFTFRFSSKYEDLETGLNYYGYRYYSSDLGRWLNRDPITERGGFNIYSFVMNNSVDLVDIDGRSFFSRAISLIATRLIVALMGIVAEANCPSLDPEPCNNCCTYTAVAMGIVGAAGLVALGVVCYGLGPFAQIPCWIAVAGAYTDIAMTISLFASTCPDGCPSCPA